MLRKITIFLLLVLYTTTVRAGLDDYWQPLYPGLVQTTGKRNLFPDQFQTYVLRTAALREKLFALKENPEAGQLITLPAPDGGSRTFRVWQSTMMEPSLAAKYPDIKTFTAEATDNRQVTAKIDFSPAGFHAMIFDGGHTYFIDPYSNIEDGNYICFYKKNYSGTSNMSCQVPGIGTEAIPKATEGPTAMRTNGTQRKTYRLALACTGEYATAVGGTTPTKASVLAQMVLIMNRVNGVYEREFSATMTLVANTDTLIFLNGNTDPYTNNDGPTMLGQNQSTVTTLIGSANYDIGHVFSTGGGGIAGLGVLCNGTNKARGVTGLTNPVGDAFAIDYVAHEMGHQFGSDHTFNSNLGACSGNGAVNLAFEPGSGATIMAYAGICGTDDLQAHSDAYFHAGSLRSITNYINNGSTGGSCPVLTASTNTPNTYPDFTQSYSIPLWTPFELTAPAVTDATVDTLTYCWEEWDLGGFGLSWDANNNVMPFFRSFNPTAAPVRVFPTMNNVLAGNYSYKGERLPTAARTLKFILTTRDVYQGWGCFNSSFDTDTVTLNAVATTDTFRVTSQATSTTWTNGSTQTITWNTGGTTAAPVSAANVNITLSVDSGNTFPYVLASNVPNNGSASVTIPGAVTATTKGRVKVKAANNVFFQVNRSNITINVVPLPVTLKTFTASLKNCTAQLNWSTGNAYRFSHFELERSDDGNIFKPVAVIRANNEGVYTYTDPQSKDGSYFYRLRMVDMDDKSDYSAVLALRLSCNGSNSVAVFPNPAKDKINIQSNGTIAEGLIFAANGQRVYRQAMTAQPLAQMDISFMPPGIYWLQLTHTDGSRSTLKLIKE